MSIIKLWVRPDYILSDAADYTRPATVCADGFTISIQASSYHYCEPRNNEGPYTHVEVGFPNRHENRLAPYGDDNNDIFPFVPAGVIDDIIRAHGGLKDAT
tara:strand:- start:1486 stop:1788 length:303 start_codon:yes stop_codon:yes gene_type:complete